MKSLQLLCWSVIGALLLGGLACGDDDAPGVDDEVGDGDGDGDPSGDGDGDPSGDGDGDPSGDGDGDPSGDGDGDPSGDGDGDGDPSGDGDGDGDPSGDGDGDGDPEEVSYSAEAHFGGLDRVFVYRHDWESDTCARMSLVSPVPSVEFNVVTPGSWTVEHVGVFAGADCRDLAQPDAWATAGTGTVDFTQFDMLGYFPCELDVDASFDIDTDPATQVSFYATELAVVGPDC